MQPVRLYRPGLMPYRDAWRWQRETVDAVRRGATEALAVLQHPPVYTFGRRIHRDNLLFEPPDADVVESDRGGDVTYHGPGQLVAYPILDLRRRNLGATDYVRLLEEVMIRTAAAFGVSAARIAGRPGIWTHAGPHVIPSPLEGRGLGREVEATLPHQTPAAAAPPSAKLGAVGVRVQGGVTSHGLALNVSPDLARFDAIVPCGLSDISVTSLQHELGRTPDLAAAEAAFISAFQVVFGSQIIEPYLPFSTQPPSRVRRGAAHARGARGVSPRLEGRSRQVLWTQDAQSRSAVGTEEPIDGR